MSVVDSVARNQRGVLRLCRGVLRDEHLGADAAQEAFVRLWRRLGQPGARALDRPEAWLRRAALCAALDLARRRELRSGREDAEGSPDEQPSSAPSPFAGAALDELRTRLRAALAELSEGQRTVFLLRHESGLALREVADLLELSLPTVKTQFARACVRLQARLRWTPGRAARGEGR
jgi:RNA polymerase sigma-70 factor (ECF subfamily)